MRAFKQLWVLPLLLFAASSAWASSPPMVYFASGSARLSPQAEMVLDDAVRWLRSLNAELVSVDGYADRVGSRASNMRLSLQRARMVRDALIRRGFPAERVQTRAFGETHQLIETEDGVAEAQNRYAIVMIERIGSAQ